MAIKRLKQMPELERAVVQMIWFDSQNIKNDGMWHNYERHFTYGKDKLVAKCKFQKDGFYFTYKHLTVEHETIIIDLPQGKNLH